MLARIVRQRIRIQAVTCMGTEHVQNKSKTPKQIFLIIDFDAEQVVHVLCLRQSDTQMWSFLQHFVLRLNNTGFFWFESVILSSSLSLCSPRVRWAFPLLCLADGITIMYSKLASLCALKHPSMHKYGPGTSTYSVAHGLVYCAGA